MTCVVISQAIPFIRKELKGLYQANKQSICKTQLMLSLLLKTSELLKKVLRTKIGFDSSSKRCAISLKIWSNKAEHQVQE